MSDTGCRLENILQIREDMQDLRAPKVRHDADRLIMIVPDAQFAAGVSVCKLSGLSRVCWPESQRALALQWQTLMLAADTLSAPATLQTVHHGAQTAELRSQAE